MTDIQTQQSSQEIISSQLSSNEIAKDYNTITSSINVKLVDCFPLIKKAWDAVTPTTIRNCWRKTGLLPILMDMNHGNFDYYPNEEGKKEYWESIKSKSIDWREYLIEPMEESIERLETTMSVSIDHNQFVSPLNENEVQWSESEELTQEEVIRAENYISFLNEIQSIFDEIKDKLNGIDISMDEKKQIVSYRYESLLDLE